MAGEQVEPSKAEMSGEVPRRAFLPTPWGAPKTQSGLWVVSARGEGLGFPLLSSSVRSQGTFWGPGTTRCYTLQFPVPPRQAAPKIEGDRRTEPGWKGNLRLSARRESHAVSSLASLDGLPLCVNPAGSQYLDKWPNASPNVAVKVLF